MELLLKLIGALALGVVGVPVGVTDVYHPSRDACEPAYTAIPPFNSDDEVAGVNVRPDRAILDPAIGDQLFIFLRGSKAGDHDLLIRRNNEPSLATVVLNVAVSWIRTNLNDFAGSSAAINDLDCDAFSLIGIHLANIATNRVEDRAFGFYERFCTRLGVDRSTPRIKGGSGSRKKGEQAYPGTNSTEQPCGIGCAARGIRRLPLGAQVGSALIITLFAGLLVSGGGIRLMQGRWLASAALCGLGSGLLLLLILTAWAGT